LHNIVTLIFSKAVVSKSRSKAESIFFAVFANFVSALPMTIGFSCYRN